MPHASVAAEITGNGVSRGIAACLHILVNLGIPCGILKSWRYSAPRINRINDETRTPPLH